MGVVVAASLWISVYVSAAFPAVAREWQEIESRDAGLELRLGWDWVAADRGKFWQSWTTGYEVQDTAAAWTKHQNWKLELLVRRLAPGLYWKQEKKISRDFLRNWDFLKVNGVRDLKYIDCDALSCAQFRAYTMYCVGFNFTTGPTGFRQSGDRGSHVVYGYFCAPDGSAKRELENILAAIRISK